MTITGANSVIYHRYDIKWVGHCKFDNSDKIWGWFLYNDPTSSDYKKTSTSAYAFWAATGKTPNFKRHSYTSWTMDKLVREKKNRKYNEIAVEKVLELWPSVYEDINNRFVFYLLVGDT